MVVCNAWRTRHSHRCPTHTSDGGAPPGNWMSRQPSVIIVDEIQVELETRADLTTMDREFIHAFVRTLASLALSSSNYSSNSSFIFFTFWLSDLLHETCTRRPKLRFSLHWNLLMKYSSVRLCGRKLDYDDCQDYIIWLVYATSAWLPCTSVKLVTKVFNI